MKSACDFLLLILGLYKWYPAGDRNPRRGRTFPFIFSSASELITEVSSIGLYPFDGFDPYGSTGQDPRHIFGRT